MNIRPITTAQLSKIHVLLNQFGIMEDKADLVSNLPMAGKPAARN